MRLADVASAPLRRRRRDKCAAIKPSHVRAAKELEKWYNGRHERDDWDSGDRGDGANFILKACRRVLLTNLSVDWDWEQDPLGEFVTVVDTHLGARDTFESYLDLQFADNAALLENVFGWLSHTPVTAEMREEFRRNLFLTEADLRQIAADEK